MTKPALSEARKVTASATSVGLPAGPPAQGFELFAVAVAVEVAAGEVGLDVARSDRVDGHAVPAHSRAITRIIWLTAPLVAA